MNQTEYCEFGMHYGCCSSTDKNGHSVDTDKIHKAAYEVKTGEGFFNDTFNVCKGCAPVIFGYEDYDEENRFYDIKTGEDRTSDIFF